METILIVDDNPQGQEVASSCLKEHGVKPVFAKNGREALEVVVHSRPDAVLTVLRMPVMDGLSLVENMRRDHPSVPVVLMTDPGSEQIAVAALKAGAASYVPKKDLRTNLCETMSVVITALEAKKHREKIRELLKKTESHFVLGPEREGPMALISHFESNLSQLDFCDETALFQVSTALTEALINAVEHGNLELDSALREQSEQAYTELREKRMNQPPYRDRRAYVTERLSHPQATYVIRDEGPGFDPSTLPDPRVPENLLKASGRGIMLIRTFMDEVTFNETGNEIKMMKRRMSGR